jgi:hypothetical protein
MRTYFGFKGLVIFIDGIPLGYATAERKYIVKVNNVSVFQSC